MNGDVITDLQCTIYAPAFECVECLQARIEAVKRAELAAHKAGDSREQYQLGTVVSMLGTMKQQAEDLQRENRRRAARAQG